MQKRIGTAHFVFLAFLLSAVSLVIIFIWCGFLNWKPVAGGEALFEPSGYLMGRDFLNTYMAGKTFLLDRVKDVFVPAHYQQMLQEFAGATYPPHAWSYPPHAYLLAVPFGLMPHSLSFVLWSLTGLALYYIFACKLLNPTAKNLFFLLLSPAVLLCLWAGQNGLITSGLLLAAWFFLEKKPALAGLCLGLLTIKPQLGLLIPLVLVLMGAWRVIFFAALTTIILVASSLVLFGTEPWLLYIENILPLQTRLLYEGEGPFLFMVPSAFISARILNWDDFLNPWFAQLPFTLLAFFLTWQHFKKPSKPLFSLAMLLVCSALVTPYIFNYDLVALAAVALILTQQNLSSGFCFIALIVFMLPALVVVFGTAALPISPLILTIFALLLNGEAKKYVPTDAPAAALN